MTGLWCRKQTRDLPTQKKIYKLITAMLIDVVEEPDKQIRARTLNKGE
jgi:hypothetical protein